MSQIRMDSEDVAEIKNALQVIQGTAELMRTITTEEKRNAMIVIVKQVKRIDKLLPQVKFEGGKQCQQLKKG